MGRKCYDSSRNPVIVFTGGRGNSALITELARQPSIDLTLIVNGYDDGMSTGAFRRAIPSMLGPSDFRKNMGVLSAASHGTRGQVAEFLEIRMPLEDLQFNEGQIKHLLNQKIHSKSTRRHFSSYIKFLLRHLDNLDPSSLVDLKSSGEIALGNVIFAGLFLKSNLDFNRTVETLISVIGIESNIVNVSSKEQFYLSAITSEGKIIADEALLVENETSAHISDFFFVKERPLDEEIEQLDQMESLAFLRDREQVPMLNPEAEASLARRSVIILGSGTLFSSLLPSYRIASKASLHPASTVIGILNLDPDNDTPSLTHVEQIKLICKEMRLSSHSIQFIRSSDSSIPLGKIEELPPHISVSEFSSLRDDAEPHRHDGSKLLSAINSTVVSTTTSDRFNLESINELARSNIRRGTIGVADFGASLCVVGNSGTYDDNSIKSMIEFYKSAGTALILADRGTSPHAIRTHLSDTYGGIFRPKLAQIAGILARALISKKHCVQVRDPFTDLLIVRKDALPIELVEHLYQIETGDLPGENPVIFNRIIISVARAGESIFSFPVHYRSSGSKADARYKVRRLIDYFLTSRKNENSADIT